MMDRTDIVLHWKGTPYRLRHDMRAVRQVERVLMRDEVREDLARGGKLLPIDMAEIFANLLNAAGCPVTHEEVDEEMFGFQPSAEMIQTAMEVIMAIANARVSPERRGTPEQNPQKPAATTPSSRKRTRQRSASGA